MYLCPLQDRALILFYFFTILNVLHYYFLCLNLMIWEAKIAIAFHSFKLIVVQITLNKNELYCPTLL